MNDPVALYAAMRETADGVNDDPLDAALVLLLALQATHLHVQGSAKVRFKAIKWPV